MTRPRPGHAWHTSRAVAHRPCPKGSGLAAGRERPGRCRAEGRLRCRRRGSRGSRRGRSLLGRRLLGCRLLRCRRLLRSRLLGRCSLLCRCSLLGGCSLLRRCGLLGRCGLLRSCHNDLLDQVAKSTAPLDTARRFASLMRTPHAMACRRELGAANGDASLHTVSEGGASVLAMRNMKDGSPEMWRTSRPPFHGRDPGQMA